MKKDKYDFIQELLSNKRLISSQKDKIVKLLTLEIEKDKVSIYGALKKIELLNQKDLRLIERIEKIEESLMKINIDQTMLGLLNDKEKSTSEVNTKRVSDKIITIHSSQENRITPEPNPKHVADFMSLFNQRNGLKYLTHDYDENSEFNIDEFLDSAKGVFNSNTKKLFIPQSLWQIVNKFAFTTEQTDWTSISEDYKRPLPISIGWATKELRTWSKQNRLHPIRNSDYEKVINSFKKITRIESPNLEKLINITIEETFKENIEDFLIEKIDLSKADFYSHVAYLKTALETIFEEINKRSDEEIKKKITIRYERSLSSDGYFLRKIIITHHNSFPEKELSLLLAEWKDKGNMGKIREFLKGYCHWSVETLIEEEATRINILRDYNTDEYELVNGHVEGFTHILTFYYK